MRSPLAAHEEFLLTCLERQPDATLADIQRQLAGIGVKAGLSSICRFYRRRGISFKKKSLRAAEQDRPDVAKARAEWRESQPTLDPGRLIFIDETWTKTNMVRLYGRCDMGQRLVAAAPHGHWNTSTFIAGLRQDGLIAPCVFDGAINGELFLAYVEQVLVPTLTASDIVIMDNLGSHKVAGVSPGHRGHRRQVALPAALQSRSEPDRTGFRQTQNAPAQGAERNVEAACQRIGQLLAQFTSVECGNYFKNCGYG